MADIRKLKTKTLEQLALTNNFIYLLNTATNEESKLAVSSLVQGSAVSLGTGTSIYAGVSNNKLGFKSFSSLDSIINLTGDSENIGINVNLNNIDLSKCSNTTSLFLSTVDLTTNVGATILPVANGGTGASTLTDGGILLGSGTGAITAMAALAAGTIIQGDGTTDPTTLALGTAGQVLTVNAGATAAEWAAAGAADNLGNHTATTTLDMANNNIDLGTGWINKNGTGAYGINIDTANRVHVIPDGEASFLGTAGLNLAGDLLMSAASERTIKLGNTSSGHGYEFMIDGSSVTTASNGGAIHIRPGSAVAGTGGSMNIYGGSSVEGVAGDISLFTRSGASTTFPILRITNTKKVSIQNSTSNKVPTGLLDVHQTEASGSMPAFNLIQDDDDYAFVQFVGTSAADSTKNLSHSTGTAGTKSAAVKIKYKNGAEDAVDGWIRIYNSAV